MLAIMWNLYYVGFLFCLFIYLFRLFQKAIQSGTSLGPQLVFLSLKDRPLYVRLLH